MDSGKLELLAENSRLRDELRRTQKSLVDLRGIIETNLPELTKSDAMRAANDLLWGSSRETSEGGDTDEH